MYRPIPPKNMNTFNTIKEHIAELEADAKAFFEKGNKSAGTRLRKGMLELKGMAQQLRLEVSEKKNNG